MQNLHDIVGVVTYKEYVRGKLSISVTSRGVVHQCVAYGRTADLYYGMINVHNTYRIKLCQHDSYGVVMCGVEKL